LIAELITNIRRRPPGRGGKALFSGRRKRMFDRNEMRRELREIYSELDMLRSEAERGDVSLLDAVNVARGLEKFYAMENLSYCETSFRFLQEDIYDEESLRSVEKHQKIFLDTVYMDYLSEMREFFEEWEPSNRTAQDLRDRAVRLLEVYHEKYLEEYPGEF